jgi:hypothetical protein
MGLFIFARVIDVFSLLFINEKTLVDVISFNNDLSAKQLDAFV